MTRHIENWKTAALGLLIGIATLGGLAKPSHAAVEVITCPVGQVTGQIVNPMPTDWWTTPVRNRLQSVRVANSGGNTYLICDYGAAGFIQREAPAGANCRAVGNRFRCNTLVVVPIPIPIPVPTPTPTPIPAPSSGSMTMSSGQGVDLDANNPGRNTSDLTLSGATNVVTLNGAQRAGGFSSAPSRAQCRGASYGAGAFNATVGTHWCIVTSDGRYARISVTNFSSGRVDQLEFDYRVFP